MTITKRLNIEAQEYNQIKDLTLHGHMVRGALSPYDLPRQATVAYEPEKREFRIHFIYLTPDEPTAENPVSKEISLYLGEKSGKLYDIVIRGQAPDALRAVRLKLIGKVEDLARESEKDSPANYVKQLNLLVAKRFLEERDELYTVDK